MSEPITYRSKKTGKVYFFSKRLRPPYHADSWFYFPTTNPNNALTELPEGFYIKESWKNGVPNLKKKAEGLKDSMDTLTETDGPGEAP